jgi:hypothetical protein
MQNIKEDLRSGPMRPAVPGQPVIDPAGWTKEELAATDEWMEPLADSDIAELDAAVSSLVSRGVTSVLEVSPGDYDLPTLAPKLRRMSDDVINGRGFVLIRGVPVQRYSRLESALAFWCIGHHFGEPVSQNAKGHLLGHVADLGGTSFKNPSHRGYQTHDRLPYHSDSCDVVGLLCLHHSKTGGASMVTSSVTIHNEMLKRRPDLVAALAEPIYRDRRNEVPEGKDPWFQRPVFNYYDGRLTTSWQGGYIRSSERFEELPRRSDALNEALDMFTKLANELCFGMDFQPGDIQFLHNHVMVHSRTDFEDFPEPERRRHLLRLWLSTPEGRPLPPIFSDKYGHLGPDERPSGGVMVPGTKLTAPLDPE